jgi:hypothetical protein
MPVWKLTPTDPADPAWKTGAHRGAIVRAASEGAARRVTAAAFQELYGSGAPWTDPSRVAAEEVHDGRYDPKGRSEVLEAVG